MSDRYPALPDDAAWDVARVFYPAGRYDHPAAGLLQLRMVRRGSSHAEIDLGAGLRSVFTRPGDLLLSLPDRPTVFRIVEGRELVVLQARPALAEALVRRAGGRELDELRVLSRRPVREPVAAELMRRLDADVLGSPEARDWALGVVVAVLLARARDLAAAAGNGVLTRTKLDALVERVKGDIAEPWPVDRLARAAGLARRPFANAFKEATGLPVHQFVVRLRAERAAELLRSTSLPIGEVASRAGFAHQAHLTRVTSRLLGASPKRIRDEARAARPG